MEPLAPHPVKFPEKLMAIANIPKNYLPYCRIDIHYNIKHVGNLDNVAIEARIALQELGFALENLKWKLEENNYAIFGFTKVKIYLIKALETFKALNSYLADQSNELKEFYVINLEILERISVIAIQHLPILNCGLVDLPCKTEGREAFVLLLSSSDAATSLPAERMKALISFVSERRDSITIAQTAKIFEFFNRSVFIYLQKVKMSPDEKKIIKLLFKTQNPPLQYDFKQFFGYLDSINLTKLDDFKRRFVDFITKTQIPKSL